MNAIGGYFELELMHGEEYHKNAIKLNTGRNAFEYVLRVKAYQKIYLPYFTCDAMLEPIQKLNLDYQFYSIDEQFRPIFDFSKIEKNSAFVYTNYFGLCDKIVKEVHDKCINLIIDNSQAFYSQPISRVDTFYSPRKFFGVPDGAYLYTDILLDYKLETDLSFQRFHHLLGRMDKSAEEFFDSYKNNEEALSNQAIRQMSKITQKILSGIDYHTIAEVRIKNFNLLNSQLKNRNQLKLNLELGVVPMVYPFLINEGLELKKILIENCVFTATYWPNILDWCNDDQLEFAMTKEIIYLPVDQRYGEFEMKKIIETISNKRTN